MSDILKRLTSKYDITPEDESVYPDGEPRNWVANKLNPYIGDLIPKVSVADRKRGLNDMLDPEQAAMNFGMGGIANTSKFGALARKFGGANMAVPKLEEGLSKRISQAFKEMKHDPTNPEVKEAYDALIKEVTEQYDDLVKNGLKVDKIKGENPYKTSKDLHEKVNKSNSMEYFPTEQGFGAGKTLENPLLNKTGRFNASGEEMLANDLFRVVHDIHGHVKPQASFGPVGEEVAYQNHKQMFSPKAQKALATETRGQNSFVNFGDNAANNRANPSDTIFAEQKIGLLPDFAVNENAAKVIQDGSDYIPYLRLGQLLKGENK